MSFAEGFWLVLFGAAMLWYSTITVAVAVLGFKDIREMLVRLGQHHHDGDGDAR